MNKITSKIFKIQKMSKETKEQINDLQLELDENIDLSDYINLDLKVQKLDSKNLEDFSENKKNLSLRPKMNIKLQKNNTKNFDALNFSYFEKNIDLNKEEDKDSLKKKLAIMKFKLKNIDFKNKEKKEKFLQIDDYKIEKFDREEKEEEVFVENFIQKNTKWDFQVYPLYKPKTKINFFKIAFIFASILFVVLLDKIVIEALVKTSYSDLILLKNNTSSIEKVKSIVSSSSTRLYFADILFKPFSIVPNETIKNVNHIIDWWKNLTDLMKKSISLYENLDKKLKQNWWPANLYATDILTDLRKNYDEINDLLVKTYLEYSKITDLWDKSLNEKLSGVKEKLNLALIWLDKVNKNYDVMLSLLWEYKDKKYLVVFQNDDEIRATWGFIWSMALLDLRRWKVEKIETKDVYAMEWQINQVFKDKEKAPTWLDQITKTFWFKDSAQKIKFFLDKIDLKVDWVIFINQNIILDLISSIGWVYSETFWTEVTAENFSTIVSTLVEAEVFKEGSLGSPKQALFLFSEELYKQLNLEKKYYDYLKIIIEHVKNRDLVIYSFNPVENSFLWKIWLNWELNFKETFDFNYPVYTSIWWNKSDRFMQYRYDKTVSKIKDSCDFNIKLKIFNTHSYTSENEQNVRNILSKYNNLGKNIEDIINIQWRWDNRSFLRILLPKNAEVKLLDWQNLIESEKYKTLELYTRTKAWETTDYEINYILKNKDCKDYSYKFFKQPWIKDYQILFNVFWKQNEYNNIKTDFIY